MLQTKRRIAANESLCTEFCHKLRDPSCHVESRTMLRRIALMSGTLFEGSTHRIDENLTDLSTIVCQCQYQCQSNFYRG